MSSDLRLLRTADIPAAMALVRQAGWNQTPADWARFLRAQPDGCFAASDGDRLVGTVTTIVYESDLAKAAVTSAEAFAARRRLAWIGMMLVDAGHRGQGIGTRLLARALERLDRSGISCVKLDATPEGKALYERHGFVVEQALERWELARSSAPAATAAPGLAAPPIEDIIVLDRQLFGADRGDLLRSISAEAPDLTVVIRDWNRDPETWSPGPETWSPGPSGPGSPGSNSPGPEGPGLRTEGELLGYACGRHGTRADHLGPWMAHDARAADQLLQAFLARSDRPLVYIDCVTDNPWSSRVVEANGFRRSRPLTRMRRGADLFPGETRRLGAIVGPEFG